MPTDADFASSLSGKDALTLTAKLSASEIAAKCASALKLFVATDYKKDYAFIDQIAPVREVDLIEKLFRRPGVRKGNSAIAGRQAFRPSSHYPRHHRSGGDA